MAESQASAETAPTVAAAYFITWHGTVLRLDRASRRLIHARPWPVRTVADDWTIDLPESGLMGPTQSPADARMVLKPLDCPRLVTIQRGEDYLCAEPTAGEVRFSRRAAGPWENFLYVSAAELAALRDVLGHVWMEDAATGREALTADLTAGFALILGGFRAALQPRFPPITGLGGMLRLRQDGPAFTRAAEVPVRAEINLTPRPLDMQAPAVASEAEFRAAANARLSLPGGLEYGLLPLAASLADETWMLTKWKQAGARRLGPQRNACQLVRETDKFVLLSRRVEGVIFDAAGSSNETGYLTAVSICETGELEREGDHIFASGQALASAPRLQGPHAVFYGGNLSNYYHWVVDALLPLHVMAPLLPPGTKLLMPSTLRAFRQGSPDEVARQVDHLAVMRAWGFGDWPMVEIDGPVCHVEEIYWLDQCWIEQMPAAFVHAARRDALARLGPAQSGKRIYIRRDTTRHVGNAGHIEQMLENYRFTFHALEGMTPVAQMELFRDAEFVVAPHGAALANLLFCAPGTRVIEMSPDCEFRPLFAQISDKLDLVHGVLPCPTDDGGFFGRMTVDAARLRALLTHMLALPVAA